MALNNPNDPNSPYPNQPGSAFSFNFSPAYIAQLSANPTQATNGGIAPSGFANLSQQSQPQQQQQSPTAISAPQLINTGASLIKNATSSGPSALTSAINNFGGTLGFANTATSNALSAGLSSGDAAGLGSIAQGFNAAGDSVVAGSAADVGVAGTALEGTQAGATALSSGTLSGASLSGVLGAAGLGYIGGQILGKAIGGSPIGGSIGGAIGAGAGMAFGGAGAAALGLELGSAAGPIGAIVGGIGGTLFGSLFGGGGTPPTNAEAGSGTFSPNGAIAYTAGGSKNAGPIAGFTQQATNQFSNITQAASHALGIKFNPDLQFGSEISTRHPGPGGPAVLSVANPNSKDSPTSGPNWYDPNNQASVQKAQLNTLLYAAQQSGYTDTAALTSWFNNYVNGQQNTSGIGAPEPSVPLNPTPSGTSDFQKFIDNYKAQQSANAA